MRAAGIIVGVALIAGCGSDRTELGLAVGAGATFQVQAGPPAAVGYQLAVLIEQAPAAARPVCPTLPQALRLSVNGQEVAPAFDGSGCLKTQVTLGPFPELGHVTVDADDGGQPLAHAEFDGLAPGAGATLAVPADGHVHAGAEIVVVPPAALPTGEASFADIYPLDDATLAGRALTPALATRLADGVHVLLPAFAGRAAVTFPGMPYLPQATYSCPGFAACVADADNTLGPVYVTEDSQ